MPFAPAPYPPQPRIVIAPEMTEPLLKYPPKTSVHPSRDEVKERVRRLLERGMNGKEIAAQIGIGTAAVSRHLRELRA